MADDSFEKASEGFKNLRAQTEKMLQTQAELEKGISGYAKVARDIYKTQNDILHIEQQQLELKKKLKEEEKELSLAKKALADAIASGDAKEIKNAKKKVKLAKEEIKIKKANVKLLGLEVDKEQEKLDTLKQSVKESNKLKAAFNSTGNFIKKWGFDKLKEYGVFDMDKEIRNAARSMGISKDNAKAFSRNLERAGSTTVQMGVSTKQLAKMQKGYSEEIGKAGVLSEKGLEAMAGMAEGTGLGEQFAIGMAGAMDKFGGSVQTSAALVQETMDSAGEMGVNAAKASEMLSKNLKFSQKYKFKGGVKGLAAMTTSALSLRLDLEGIAGMADKVFRPEGATEMAAKLQTMGGAFAQMANPMELMFKARNDFAGFADDIGKATAEFVEYNKENGTFDIKGGLAADRMREIANMTGIGAEKLQEMAVAQAKMKMIGGVIPFKVNKKDEALIASFSTIRENGDIEVKVGELSKSIKDLSVVDMKKLRGDKATLAERAKESRTAMETLDDIKTSFTQLLIPVAQALKKDFADPLRDLLGNEKFINGIKAFVEGAADLVGGFVKFAVDNPLITAIGTIGTAIAGKAFMWYQNGKTLGMGFNSVASAGGGGFGRGRGMGAKQFGKNRAAIKQHGSAKAARAARGGKFGLGKGFKATPKGMGVGMGLGVAGMGLDMARGQMQDQHGTTGKMMGIGSAALQGAGMGMMFGPWGAAIGGLAGGLYGGYNEYFSKEAQEREKHRGGHVNQIPVKDGMVKFNTNDKFAQMEDGMLMASTSQGALTDSVEKYKSGGDVTHKFDDIKINITIDAKGIDEAVAKSMIDNKSFIRSLNTKIREEASMVLSGGVLSPTPK